MSLYDIAKVSRVHQILLSTGEIDRLPESKIENIKNNVSVDHTLWLEKDIVNLIRDNFSPKTLEAFNKIKPLAYKADLARYCILYVYGGWYFDLSIDIVDFSVLKNYGDDYQVVIFRDVPSAGESYAIGNSVLWFRNREHPVLEDVIARVTENILSEKYENHPHSITGPNVLGEFIVRYQLDTKDSNILIGDTVMIDNRPSHIFNDAIRPNFLIFSKRRGMDVDMSDILPSGYETKSNYWGMFYDKKVY